MRPAGCSSVDAYRPRRLGEGEAGPRTRTGRGGCALPVRRLRCTRRRTGRERELQAAALGCGARPGPPARCRSAVARHGRAQLVGCPAGRSCLGSVALRFPHVSDGLGQPGEAAKERHLGEGRIAGDGRGCGQQPGCPAQVVARLGRMGNRTVGGTGGAIVGIGRLAEHPAAQRGRGGMQGVGRSPGRVSGPGWGLCTTPRATTTSEDA